jgi:uracil-DNA glycosylase
MDQAASSIASLGKLAQAEANCGRCPLYRDATQAVPGEGPKHAKFMLVGEQPGDREDLAGKPFVGPAAPIRNIAPLRKTLTCRAATPAWRRRIA